MKVIEEVGLTNVVQLITDNASFCSAAGMRVQAKYHTSFWTPCVVHTLNVALKTICTLEQEGSDRYEQFK